MHVDLCGFVMWIQWVSLRIETLSLEMKFEMNGSAFALAVSKRARAKRS